MRKRNLGFLAVAAIALLSGANSNIQAAENCIRVVDATWETQTLNPDPSRQVTMPDVQLVRMLYDPFIDLDDSMKPVAVLAKSWESNAAGSEWIFHLREGVTFHDGSPLTAEDVVYTYRRLLDPATHSPGQAEFGAIQSDNFKSVDANTIKVTLSTPEFELPVVLASKFALIIKRGTTADQLFRHPIGTGPFMIASFTPGAAKYVLTRNPHYWRAGLPKPRCIQLTGITESVSRLSAILSGEADVAAAIDQTAAATLEGNPNVTVVRATAGTAVTMGMFVDTPPFKDVRVREAMKLVIDRNAMVKTALLGFGFGGNDNPVPPSSPDSYRADLIARDVAKAKQLLAEAGYPNGLAVDLYLADVLPGAMAMGQSYQQMAADAGITVNLIVVPGSEYWDSIWLKKSFSVSVWSARPTAVALAVAYRKNAKWNETHWYRDDYDALLDKAKTTADAGERRKLYQAAERMLTDEGGVIIPMFSTEVGAIRKGCTGYRPPADSSRPDFDNVTCQ